MVLAAVAHHLAATGEEHEVGGTVPLLDHVQPFVDLAAQRFGVQIAAEVDRLDRLAQLGSIRQCPIGVDLVEMAAGDTTACSTPKSRRCWPCAV